MKTEHTGYNLLITKDTSRYSVDVCIIVRRDDRKWTITENMAIRDISNVLYGDTIDMSTWPSLDFTAQIH